MKYLIKAFNDCVWDITWFTITRNTIPIISSDYVHNDSLVHFEKIKKTVELAYNQVIESLNEKVLPYMPNIYPIPFMIAKTYAVHAETLRVLFYSIVYPDKSNFEMLAIQL